MELKVWVEGIQRVVCGVSEGTTCQEVVVALAHATGKTGRFTLIEKWRDTERLLAPADFPLKSLHKWGEYASEVVFVLRHSEKHRKERSSKRTDKFSHNFSPHQAPPQSTPDSAGTPSKGLKKSLTFSGAHSYPKNRLAAVRRHLIQDNSSLESIDDQSSVTSQSSISTMSPYSSLEKRHHRHRGHSVGAPHHNNNNKPMFSSLEKHKSKAHRLKSPSSYSSNNHYSQQSPRSGSNTPNGSLERQRSNSHSPHELTPKIEQLEGYNLQRRLPGDSTSNGAIPKSRPAGSIDFTKLNGNVGKDTEFREKSPPRDSSTAEKDDLAKLIKLQQEKLSIQASQIKVLDTEIQYWETREKDLDRQSAQIAAELESVQRRDDEVDNELQELDLVSWADKLEIEKQNQKTLQSEITLMRSRLSNCETELLQNKNKSLLLTEDIEKEKKELSKQEQAQKEKEIKIIQDISEVQRQLNEKLVQYEKNQDDIESLQNEVKAQESSILDGKAQLGDSEKELREVNMSIFMKVPNSLEGSSSGLNRNSSSRPGSARRMMYSPVLLKEAVATTTNPHGLWV